jgi:DHA1 family tetracycline resistance protein-like MFS transporter
MDIGLKTILLGFFVSIYPLSLFFGAPIIGALSDRIGRKKTFFISISGEVFGFLLFGVGILLGSLPLAAFSRVVQGFSGGNIATAYSSIADVSKKEDKTKNFALVGLAFGLGMILGPFIGGYLSDSSIVGWFNYSTPFLFAALLASLNILSVNLFFKETLKTRIERKLSLLTGFRNLKKAWSFENLRIMFVVSFLVIFGFNFYTQFFQVLLIEKFDFTARQIGEFFAFAGFWIVFTQGFLIRVISNRFTSEKVLKVTIFTLALGLVLIALPNKVWLMFTMLPLIAVSNALTNPNMTTIISNLTHKDSQGEIMGITQSINAVAMAIPPIIAGFIYSLNIYLPSIAAATCVGLAAIIFLFFFKMTKPEFEEE